MEIYTNVNIHFVYGFCDGNAAAAERVYQMRYPDRRHPERRVFEAVHCGLRETGSFKTWTHIGRGRRNVQDDEVVLDAVMIIHQVVPVASHLKQAPLKVQHGMCYVKIVCILFIYNLCKGYNLGTKSVVLSIVNGFYTE
jgi:hypothetical protein